jgi:hypothetical protein
MQSSPRPAGSITRLTRALRHPRSIRIQARNARPPSLCSFSSLNKVGSPFAPESLASRSLPVCRSSVRGYSSDSRISGETSTASPPVSEPGLEGWETVIGLEIHAQIRTDHKLFSASRTSFEEQPNTNVVPFDAGFPGTLPVSPYLDVLCDSMLDEW